VAGSYAMGKDFSLEGTPSIVLMSGEMVDGYMPPDVLVQRLKDQTQQH
jgi:thiol:disulfide interchange protein DsbC